LNKIILPDNLAKYSPAEVYHDKSGRVHLA
jgi:hypothetical protein